LQTTNSTVQNKVGGKAQMSSKEEGEEEEDESVVNGVEVVARAWTVETQRQLMMAGALLRTRPRETGKAKHTQHSGTQPLESLRATLEHGVDQPTELDMLRAIGRRTLEHTRDLERVYDEQWREHSALEQRALDNLSAALAAFDRAGSICALTELRKQRRAKLRLLQNGLQDNRIAEIQQRGVREQATYVKQVAQAHEIVDRTLEALVEQQLQQSRSQRADLGSHYTRREPVDCDRARTNGQTGESQENSDNEWCTGSGSDGAIEDNDDAAFTWRALGGSGRPIGPGGD
jgi:hypothetical protein